MNIFQAATRDVRLKGKASQGAPLLNGWLVPHLHWLLTLAAHWKYWELYLLRPGSQHQNF